MNYLLDTNIVIAVLKRDAVCLEALRKHRPEDVALSSVVLFELFFGAFNAERVAKNLANIENLLFPVLDFDADDAVSSGRIKAQLAKAGRPIGPYDVMIAGQALARSLILVTHNVREFSRVEGLNVEDWLR